MGGVVVSVGVGVDVGVGVLFSSERCDSPRIAVGTLSTLPSDQIGRRREHERQKQRRVISYCDGGGEGGLLDCAAEKANCRRVYQREDGATEPDTHGCVVGVGGGEEMRANGRRMSYELARAAERSGCSDILLQYLDGIATSHLGQRTLLYS